MHLLKLRLCVFALVCCLSVKTHANNDEIGLTKFGAKAGPSLKFFYCYSCGYRKVFEDYVNILHQKYPELHIDGENFVPSGYNMFIANCLVAAKIIVIILVSSRVDIFRWIRQPQPSWWQWCINNRLYACIMLFFLCNVIEGHLKSSGAFEIHLNDIPVWSKLETGRIPQPPELFQILETHMRFQKVDIGNIGPSK